MSEFNVVVFRLGKIGKHPNADRLEITTVFGSPVIMQTGSFNKGDLAVHIPPDAIVDTSRPEFAWLADKGPKHRVKFCKLRGIPSFGFLIPCPEGFEEGTNLQAYLGIEKYLPPSELTHDGRTGISGPKDGTAPHYDIEGMRKFSYVIKEDEEVQCTEKIHGMNARWVYSDCKFYAGSRTQWREDSIWNRMAEKYKLEDVLKHYPGVTLYGEIYGNGVQDLDYDSPDSRVVFFDAYDSVAGVWLDVAELKRFCVSNDLPMCPVLYQGPYKPDAMHELAEGLTVLGNGKHVREGVVIKPLRGRYDAEIGRVFLKIAGEGYLGRKDG